MLPRAGPCCWNAWSNALTRSGATGRQLNNFRCQARLRNGYGYRFLQSGEWMFGARQDRCLGLLFCCPLWTQAQLNLLRNQRLCTDHHPDGYAFVTPPLVMPAHGLEC